MSDKKGGYGNPRRLYLLLRAIYLKIIDGIQAEKPDIFNKFVRDFDGEVSNHELNNGVSDKRPIRYFELEAYARIINVPTGVLLLVSRYQTRTLNEKGKDFQPVEDMIPVENAKQELQAVYDTLHEYWAAGKDIDLTTLLKIGQKISSPDLHKLHISADTKEKIELLPNVWTVSSVN